MGRCQSRASKSAANSGWRAESSLLTTTVALRGPDKTMLDLRRSQFIQRFCQDFLVSVPQVGLCSRSVLERCSTFLGSSRLIIR